MADSTAPHPAALASGPVPTSSTSSKSTNAAKPYIPGGMTRREFLYYIWGASMAFFLLETAGISILITLPRFRAGQFGGVITTAVTDWPKPNSTPLPNNAGSFWMTTVDDGVIAQYKVCTHMGCVFNWDNNAHQFTCPCHGSLFQINGDWIAGPAPRGLDRFAFQVLDKSGKLLADSQDGHPVPLTADAYVIAVDTGHKTLGKSHF